MARHRTSQVPPAVDTIRFEHKPHGGIPSIRTWVRLSDDPSDHTSDELHGGIEPPRPAPLPRRWAADDPVPVFRFLRSPSQDSITSFHGRLARDVIHVPQR